MINTDSDDKLLSRLPLLFRTNYPPLSSLAYGDRIRGCTPNSLLLSGRVTPTSRRSMSTYGTVEAKKVSFDSRNRGTDIPKYPSFCLVCAISRTLKELKASLVIQQGQR